MRFKKAKILTPARRQKPTKNGCICEISRFCMPKTNAACIMSIMVKIRQLPGAFKLMCLVAAIFVGGLLTSMILTKDQRWIEWHISRLGEGGQISAYVFNLTLAIIALLFVVIMTILGNSPQKHNVRYGAWRATGIAIAICWVAIAFFPFDRFPDIHNFFGYSMLVLMALHMLAFPQIILAYSKSAYTSGVISVALSVILIVLHHTTGLVSLLFAEAVGLSLFMVWALVITYNSKTFPTCAV